MTRGDREVRYVLTRKGMEYLAVRAGVPPETFARHGGVTYFDPEAGERPEDAVRHIEHTIGVNRFVARLAADLREQGGRLVRWLNEAESAHRFEWRGRRAWIRPDASCELSLGRVRRWFLLEHERGTLGGGDLRANSPATGATARSANGSSDSMTNRCCSLCARTTAPSGASFGRSTR